MIRFGDANARFLDPLRCLEQSRQVPELAGENEAPPLQLTGERQPIGESLDIPGDRGQAAVIVEVGQPRLEFAERARHRRAAVHRAGHRGNQFAAFGNQLRRRVGRLDKKSGIRRVTIRWSFSRQPLFRASRPIAMCAKS